MKTISNANLVGISANIISQEQAISMRKNYLENVAPVIEGSKNEKYDASDFVWISFETLKQYVAMLEDVNNLNSNQVSGVRIYFGQHASSLENGTAAPFPNRETIFFAPTTKVEDNNLSLQYPMLKHIPFSIIPEGSNTLQGEFVEIDGLMNSCDARMKNSTTTERVAVASKTSLILDNLGIIPPPKQN